MRKTLFCLGILIAAVLHAEFRIYKGWSESYGDCIATFKDGRLYKGWSESYGDCKATYQRKRLYKGWSESYGDCIFSFSKEPPPALIAWLMYYSYRGEFLLPR